jgi:hypothetical protein
MFSSPFANCLHALMLQKKTYYKYFTEMEHSGEGGEGQ